MCCAYLNSLPKVLFLFAFKNAKKPINKYLQTIFWPFLCILLLKALRFAANNLAFCC